MLKKIIGLIVFFCFIFDFYICKSNNSKIIGFGPLEPDIFLPRSTCIVENNLYILDHNFITIYDVNTKIVIKKINISNIDSTNTNFENPTYWKSKIRKFHSDQYNSYLFKDPQGYQTDYAFGKNTSRIYTKQSISVDQLRNIYLFIEQSIIIINSSTGTIINKIDLPDEVLTYKANEQIGIAMKLYDNNIFIIKIIIDINNKFVKENNIFILNNIGNLTKKIVFLPILTNQFINNDVDFIYIDNLRIFGFIMNNKNSEFDNNSIPLQLYTDKGKPITINGNSKVSIISYTIGFQEPNKIILSGKMFSSKDMFSPCSLLVFEIKEISDSYISLIPFLTIQHPDFGNVSIYVSTSKKYLAFITSGIYYNIWDFKVFLFNSETCVFVSSSPMREGQINNYSAFCINPESDLFVINFGCMFINKFKENAISKIDLDLEIITSFREGQGPSYTPIIFDMSATTDSIYIGNYFYNTICKYSLKTKKWKKIFSNYNNKPRRFQWIDIESDENILYLLDNYTNENNNPLLYAISEDESSFYCINDFSKSTMTLDNPPLFLDFLINNTEFQFMDNENQAIWIYDFNYHYLKEIVQLPQDENSFYSSFDLYPDGSWIVTDVTQHRLLHVARNGELLETIGSKGQIEIGTTKEAYLEKPDQFYFPIRAKIANNNIYVSDFGNCRYHVIPIEPLTINWKEKSIQHENVSIFSSESGSLHYDISSPSFLSYEVTSSVPWLTIRNSTGSLSDKQIDYQILGDKLTPWKIQEGEIRFTFPEQWAFLNHTIPVSVNAIGSTVELTIGSIQAKVDGRWVAMELGYIPVIKQGRTCIGLRFLTEYLFRSHASIEYEAAIQRIKVTTKEHTIYMIVNHPIASVDGKSVSLDVPPFIQQGRTMIPLRFVSESLEAEVSWDSAAQKVTIRYPGKEKKP